MRDWTSKVKNAAPLPQPMYTAGGGQRVKNREGKTQIFFIWDGHSGQIFLAGYFLAVKSPHRFRKIKNVESSLKEAKFPSLVFTLWANIYGSSVGWLENTRTPTQSICYLYWKELK